MRVNRHSEKDYVQLKEMFDKMTNEEILKEYPTTIPIRLAAPMMNISESDMRYGLASNHSKFQFGITIPHEKRTEFRIDTKLFLEQIPQRKGK